MPLRGTSSFLLHGNFLPETLGEHFAQLQGTFGRFGWNHLTVAVQDLLGHLRRRRPLVLANRFVQLAGPRFLLQVHSPSDEFPSPLSSLSAAGSFTVCSVCSFSSCSAGMPPSSPSVDLEPRLCDRRSIKSSACSCSSTFRCTIMRMKMHLLEQTLMKRERVGPGTFLPIRFGGRRGSSTGSTATKRCHVSTLQAGKLKLLRRDLHLLHERAEHIVDQILVLVVHLPVLRIAFIRLQLVGRYTHKLKHPHWPPHTVHPGCRLAFITDVCTITSPIIVIIIISATSITIFHPSGDRLTDIVTKRGKETNTPPPTQHYEPHRLPPAAAMVAEVPLTVASDGDAEGLLLKSSSEEPVQPTGGAPSLTFPPCIDVPPQPSSSAGEGDEREPPMGAAGLILLAPTMDILSEAVKGHFITRTFFGPLTTDVEDADAAAEVVELACDVLSIVALVVGSSTAGAESSTGATSSDDEVVLTASPLSLLLCCSVLFLLSLWFSPSSVAFGSAMSSSVGAVTLAGVLLLLLPPVVPALVSVCDRSATAIKSVDVTSAEASDTEPWPTRAEMASASPPRRDSSTEASCVLLATLTLLLGLLLTLQLASSSLLPVLLLVVLAP
uniref:Uncharacterized protein n=1 Tax=Anopheles atroparvus TaxID=41427 RepID=A0A182IQF6_ANOAO